MMTLDEVELLIVEPRSTEEHASMGHQRVRLTSCICMMMYLKS